MTDLTVDAVGFVATRILAEQMAVELPAAKNQRGAYLKWLNMLAPRVRPGYVGDPYEGELSLYASASLGVQQHMAENLAAWADANKLAAP